MGISLLEILENDEIRNMVGVEMVWLCVKNEW